MPTNVVLRDYWVSFDSFNVSDDVLSVVSDLGVEVFSVGKGFLNLNFAGEILNFLIFGGLGFPGSPSQGENSFGSLLVLWLVTVWLRVDGALIGIHCDLELFKYIYLTV